MKTAASTKPQTKRDPLTRERILRTALTLVDREGLAAISMRRIGEELGVEAMSLYNHVANKAAILDGLFEVVLAELPPPRRASDWQKALRERARSLRSVLSAHPNALPLFVTRPAVTPGAIAHVESVLELLVSAGFSLEKALMTLQVLMAFVVGHTLSTITVQEPAQDAKDHSVPAYEQLSAEEFPRVREMARLLPNHSIEKEFEFGLDSMLAGIAVRQTPKGRVPVQTAG
jgi:AcrR family transcriptional regulator